MAVNTQKICVGSLPPDLDDRVAAAFGDGPKSDEVAALIVEAQAAAASASLLDPALSAKEVAEARRSYPPRAV
jgi:hypothetical protein